MAKVRGLRGNRMGWGNSRWLCADMAGVGDQRIRRRLVIRKYGRDAVSGRRVFCMPVRGEGSLPCAVALARWLSRQGRKNSRIARPSLLLGGPDYQASNVYLGVLATKPYRGSDTAFVMERFDGVGS